MTELLAWVWAPAVLYALLLGLGLLVDAALRTELRAGLLAPLGLAVAVVLVTPVYRLGGTAAVATPLAIVGALAGLVLGRSGLGARLRPGPAGLAGLAVYVLFLAPVALSGDATWAGYNFVNDTATNFILADLLEHHGATAPKIDSGTARIATYLVESGYPIGAHSVLASLRPLTGAPVEAVYQPGLALMAALSAAALTEIVRGARLRPAGSVIAAVLAMGGVLLYRSTLHGGIKEIALAALLSAAAAIAAIALERRLDPRTVTLVALCGLAIVLSFGAAGAAYAVALGLAMVVAAFLSPHPPSLRHVGRLAVFAVGLAVIAALPSLGATLDFARVASNVFAAEGGASTGYLGHLLRPLPLTEAAGVWVARDYRLPPEHALELLNTVLVAAAVTAAALGLVICIRRRLLPPLVLLAAALLPAAGLAHFVSPYADGKLLLTLTPPLVLIAAIGPLALARSSSRVARVVGVGGTLLLAAGVLASDLYTYRETRLAPTDRIAAMEDVAAHVPGQGLWLATEWEEYAKYFMRGARINPASEAEAPRRVALRRPGPIFGRWFDLDEAKLSYVKAFAGVIMRRSPSASRPPASFRMIYANRYYELWRRIPGVRVVEHLPLQALDRATNVPSCGKIRALARRAGPGQRIVAAEQPRVTTLSPFIAQRPPSWEPNREARGTVTPVGPGAMTGTLSTEGGRTRVWLRMTGGRKFTVRIDGRRVGSVGQVNTPGQWLEVGVVDFPAGDHRIEVSRGGAGLAPGDAVRGQLGPVALEQARAGRIVSVAPRDAGKRLCGRRFDWIERVAG